MIVIPKSLHVVSREHLFISTFLYLCDVLLYTYRYIALYTRILRRTLYSCSCNCKLQRQLLMDAIRPPKPLLNSFAVKLSILQFDLSINTSRAQWHGYRDWQRDDVRKEVQMQTYYIYTYSMLYYKCIQSVIYLSISL